MSTAEQVDPVAGPVPSALIEETTRILRWLESPGARLVPGRRAVAWSSPAYGAGGLVARIEAALRADVVRLPARGRQLRPAG